jgi:hypothetical protein
MALTLVDNMQGALKVDSCGSTMYRKLSDDGSVCINRLTSPILRIYVQPVALLGKQLQPTPQTLAMEPVSVCISHVNT